MIVRDIRVDIENQVIDFVVQMRFSIELPLQTALGKQKLC